jgi:quercetin dioxygenase-like cupin family protein
LRQTLTEARFFESMFSAFLNPALCNYVTTLERRRVLSNQKGFLSLEIKSGLLCEHDDGNFVTLVFGFIEDRILELPFGYTHFGFVVQGDVQLLYGRRMRHLTEGDFFSVVGPALVMSRNGRGIVTSAMRYQGMNIVGGPIEEVGRLKYIDGCTDSLLVPPIKKGDPCFNHLHFPSGIVQTPHTHPSVRTGIVYRGLGECLLPEQKMKAPLVSGRVFVIATGTVHSFNTYDESMDVIAFHPDSDTGMTDDDHPMINRTMINGTSAKLVEAIRTR